MLFMVDQHKLMASKYGKRKISEIKGTSSSMPVEDKMQPCQAQQFTDTKCELEKDATTLTWGEIYRAIQEQAYAELYVAGNKMKECDKKTWANIRQSRINQVATRSRLFPCLEFIRLMVNQFDLEN